MSDNIVQRNIVADDTNTLTNDVQVESSQNNITKTITSSNNGENIIEVAILPVNPITQEHQQYLLYVPVAMAGNHLGLSYYNDSDFIVNNGYVKLALSRENIVQQFIEVNQKLDNETARAIEAENALNFKIDNETTRAIEAENKLSARIEKINTDMDFDNYYDKNEADKLFVTNTALEEKHYATEDYVNTNGGKIDTIKVNGTQQTITDKNVDLSVITPNELVREFDIQTEYQPESNKVYNAYSINMLMTLFSDEITMRDGIIEGKAEKDASNLDATNVTQWQTKLNVATQKDIQDATNLAGNYIDAEIDKLDSKKADSKDVERVLGELNTAHMQGINTNAANIKTLQETSATKIEVGNTLTEAKTYTNTKITTLKEELLGPGTSEAIDTIYELADALTENADVVKALNDAIGAKVDKTTKINNKTLTQDITLTKYDIGLTKVSQLENDSGFISGYTEIDPTVPSHVKNITTTDISNWNNKLSSVPSTYKTKTENDALYQPKGSYLTSYTETDPTVPDHVKSIKSSDITNWNNKVDRSEIPTVNNSTITVKQGGTTKGSFTLNQTGDSVIELDAGGGESGSAVTLYEGLGQNTDGAMTQKATTDALSSKLNLSGGTLTGGVILSGGSGATGAGNIQLNVNGSIADVSGGTLFGRSNNGADLKIGSSTYNMLLRGKQTRPTYNGNDLALSSDIPTLGDAASKNVVTTVDTSTNLPTSNAVKTFVENSLSNVSIPDNEKITEISTQYIRITDLNAGVYRLTYNGTKYIYYNGSSSTSTHTVTGSTGQVILIVNKYSTTYWHWYYINGTTSLGTLYAGYTSTSSGSYSSASLSKIASAATSVDNMVWVSGVSQTISSTKTFTGGVTFDCTVLVPDVEV